MSPSLPMDAKMRCKPILTIIAAISFVLLQSCEPKGLDGDVKDAESKIGLGRMGAAIEAYESVARRYPDDPRRPGILLRMAKIYESILDDDEGALKAYERVLLEYPLSEASMLAREGIAGIAERRGDVEAMIESYTALIKHFPDYADRYRYRVLLGGAYISAKRFPEARSELAILIQDEKTPRRVVEQAYFAYAESYFLEGRPKKAAEWYSALIRDFPDSELKSEAKLHLATCMEEMGRLGAARVVTESVSDYPNKQVIDTRLKSIDRRGKEKPEGFEVD